MKKQAIVTAAVIVVCSLLLIAGAIFANRAEAEEYNPYYTIEYELVRVTQVVFDNYTVDDNSEHALRGSQTLNVVVLTGRYKGDTFTLSNYLGPLHEKLAKKGTVLTVTITSDSREEGYQMSVVNYNFVPLLIVMLVLFVAAVVIVGRRKGLLSLLGLIITLIAIVFILLPLWLKGWRAIPLTLVMCVYIAVFCFTLLGGVTRKTLSAMLGTVLCVLAAGLFAWVCGKAAGVSGMTMEEAEWLLDEAQSVGLVLNVRGLFVAGILISSLGAVMDVAMSIASAVTELASVNPEMTQGQLFKSGMNIGRDMIGTMTNTLILAFVGTSLNLMLIMFAAGMQPYQLINNDDIIMEVIRGVAGSMGLVLAVPLTALIASFAGGRRGNA